MPSLVFWACLLVTILPFLLRYCKALWHQDLYQYFPFLLLFVAYAAYTRLRWPWRLCEAGIASVALAVGLAVLGLAAMLQSSWLGAVAFVVLLFGFFRSQRQHDGSRATLIWLPMLMFVRLPQLWTQTIMFRLQRWTTDVSSRFLDAAFVVHHREGNTIELTSKSLFVAEACSGVQSLYTIAFLSLALMVVRQRFWWWLPVYLGFASAAAIAGNALRVTAIAIVQDWFRWDWSEGWVHEMIGYVGLAVAALLLLALDFWVQRFSESDGSASIILKREIGDRDELVWNRNWLAALAALPFALKATLSVAALFGGWMSFAMLQNPIADRPVVAKNEVLFDPQPDLMNRLGVDFAVLRHQVSRDRHGERNTRLGMNSDVWICGDASTEGTLALSQPYVGWHELTVCYAVQQWKLSSRVPISVTDGPPIVVATFQRGEREFGTLFFTAIDSDGDLPRVPGYSPTSRFLAPFELLLRDDFAELTGSAQTLMLQYWATGDRPMSDKEVQRWVTRIEDVRRKLSTEIAEQTAVKLQTTEET